PVAIFWANQHAKGVHVNVSGAGVTKYAKNPAGAQKLLEWLSSDKAQNLFTDLDMEYPANPAVKPDAKLLAWGPFKQNLINVNKAGELQANAVKLMDRAGYK
ncbi:MAG: extracellular solute-binding protein, partial [Undibacterium sp.]|nr:extracellular solute-binding protein [Undibacterium sp.]